MCFTNIALTEQATTGASVCIEAVEAEGRWLVTIRGRCKDRSELVELEAQIDRISRFLDEYILVLVQSSTHCIQSCEILSRRSPAFPLVASGSSVLVERGG